MQLDDVEELMRAKLIKKTGNAMGGRTQSWRAILTDIVNSSYASGKEEAYCQLNSTFQQNISKARALIEENRFEEAGKLSVKILQLLRQGGDVLP